MTTTITPRQNRPAPRLSTLDRSLPGDTTRTQAAEAMGGSFASAFIRATKPDAVPA